MSEGSPAVARGGVPAAPRRVICGALGAVGAHIARTILKHQSAAAIVDWDEERRDFRSLTQAALEEAAWDFCQPLEPGLLDDVHWVAARVTDAALVHGEELAPDTVTEWWHLDENDVASEPAAAAAYGARLRASLECARHAGVRRFVLLSASAHSAAEREVADYCRADGPSLLVLRPSVVVGPLSTLRTARRGANIEVLRGWLRSVREGAADRRGPLEVNLVPVDWLLDDVNDILKQPELSGVHVCASGDDVLLTAGASGDANPPPEGDSGHQATFLPLGDFGGGLRVCLRPSAVRPAVRADAPWNLRLLGAYVEALVEDLRGLAPTSVFERELVRTVDGSQVVAYGCGPRSAPSVILINAFGMPVEFLTPLAASLADSFRVVTWEHRGVPNLVAEYDSASADLAVHAEDLRCILDRNEIERADIVGWCNGAMVARRFALSFPERVGRLVFLNGAFSTKAASALTEYQTSLAELVRSASRNTNAATILSIILRRSELESPAAVPERAHLKHLAQLPYRSGELLFRYASTLRSFFDSHVSDIPIDGRIRALFITGDRDTVVHPDATLEIAARTPGAKLVCLQGSDHTAHYHDPEIARHVRCFLKHEFAPPSRVNATRLAGAP